MLKRILLIAVLSLLLPANAGEYEDAMKNSNCVFLYLYTTECGYCTKFNPIYNKIQANYSNKCKFLKIDASSDYGRKLMKDLGAYYVPYVLLINNKNNKAGKVSPQCLLNYACMQDATNKFVNQTGGAK